MTIQEPRNAFSRVIGTGEVTTALLKHVNPYLSDIRTGPFTPYLGARTSDINVLFMPDSSWIAFQSKDTSNKIIEAYLSPQLLKYMCETVEAMFDLGGISQNYYLKEWGIFLVRSYGWTSFGLLDKVLEYSRRHDRHRALLLAFKLTIRRAIPEGKITVHKDFLICDPTPRNKEAAKIQGWVVSRVPYCEDVYGIQVFMRHGQKYDILFPHPGSTIEID